MENLTHLSKRDKTRYDKYDPTTLHNKLLTGVCPLRSVFIPWKFQCKQQFVKVNNTRCVSFDGFSTLERLWTSGFCFFFGVFLPCGTGSNSNQSKIANFSKTKNSHSHYYIQSGFGRFKKKVQCSYWHPLFILAIYGLAITFHKLLYSGYSNCLGPNYLSKSMTCRVQNSSHTII